MWLDVIALSYSAERTGSSMEMRHRYRCPAPEPRAWSTVKWIHWSYDLFLGKVLLRVVCITCAILPPHDLSCGPRSVECAFFAIDSPLRWWSSCLTCHTDAVLAAPILPLCHASSRCYHTANYAFLPRTSHYFKASILPGALTGTPRLPAKTLLGHRSTSCCRMIGVSNMNNDLSTHPIEIRRPSQKQILKHVFDTSSS